MRLWLSTSSVVGLFDSNQYQKLIGEAQQRDSRQKMGEILDQALGTTPDETAPHVPSLDDEMVRRPIAVPAGNFQFNISGTIQVLSDSSIKIRIESSSSIPGYDNLCDHLPAHPIVEISCTSDQLSEDMLQPGDCVSLQVADCCGPIIELTAMSAITRLTDGEAGRISENTVSEVTSTVRQRAHPLESMEWERFEAPRGATGGCIGESFGELLEDSTLTTIIPEFVTTGDVREICRIYDLILIESMEEAERHLGDAPDNTPMIVVVNRGRSPHDSNDRREFGHFIFTRDLARDFQEIDEIQGIIIKRSCSAASNTNE